MNTSDIEKAVVAYFGIRKSYIVPNVSWGWNLSHEADLIVVSKRLTVTEVEIKITASDIRADARKSKWKIFMNSGFYDERISQIIYAVPGHLWELCCKVTPEFCGVISLIDNRVSIIRPPKNIPAENPRRKITDKELIALLRLGCMRIWKHRR